MERAIAASLLAAGLIFMAPGMGTAQEVPLVGCEHREPGHIERHGGKLVDDEYHRSRGESVTCDSESGAGQPAERHDDADNRDNNQDDGKSRYCRKHWYC